MKTQYTRVPGPTPNGGAFSVLVDPGDGSLKIVEFAADGTVLVSTYYPAPEC
jgi:hypothetical protein